MALQKDMLLDIGYIAKYHKIKSVKPCLDSNNPSMLVELGHYKDKDWRDGDFNGNVKRTHFTLTSSDYTFEQFSQMTLTQLVGIAYMFIKASKMAQQEIDGELQFEADGETPVMIESNWYNDCEDIME